jgi:hypothetical protein
MMLSLLAINFPTLILLLIALILVWKQASYTHLFLAGLVVILLGGLISLPLSEYMWTNYSEFMSRSTLSTDGLVFVLGVINSLGLGMSLYAFYKRSNNA